MARKTDTDVAVAEPASQPGPVEPDPGGQAENVTPDDLAVEGSETVMAAPPAAAGSDAKVVIARGGLNLRAGPGTEFPVLRLLPFGTRLFVIKREGAWSLVDQEGDGAADGHVLHTFLGDSAVSPPPAAGSLATAAKGFVPLDRHVLQTIMDRCGGIHIVSHLDLAAVADALNRSMLLAEAGTHLREVAFLSQAVIETDYFRTFREYGGGAGKDYYPYFGRGMHQLTWKATYAACSKAVFGDDRLVRDPDLILKDIEVNIKATAWYWRDYKPFNRLADAGDIDEIIHRLYGGTIDSPNPKVRKSVTLRRGYYKTINAILS